MIISLLYKVARKPSSVPGVLLRSDTAKAAAVLVLRHENAVLCRRLASPIRYETMFARIREGSRTAY
ncbi:hypothetical protein [Streptomyces sp. NPDC017964]|uniref:hypothetical protein n=1 Tax=Streptomyces sp. NPDC017964 TaxID=3365022 RepID=UPI00378FC4ED